MTEIFKLLISQLNSSVVLLFGMLLVSYWAVHCVTKLISKFGHHDEKLKKFDTMSDRIIELKTKVDLIYQNTNPHKLVAAHSPISLTTEGKTLANKIGAESIFNKYSSRLALAVDSGSPKNAYDIQVASMDVARIQMMDLLDANEINSIKSEAFAKGLLVEDIMNIFGVFLRDKILADKGIPIAEVDNSEPKQV